MQKSRYYPFERNRYFYGKLLTVRDFESEQKYFNDKRRLLNRLLFGPGVVAGLQVYKIDETQVTVQAGVALDDQGREILLSTPTTLKLSMQEGFTNNQYEKNVYLCIAYDEKDKEPVHSIATSQVRTDEAKECNRTLETSKLFIKETPPAPTRFEYSKLTHITSVLYADDKVRVLQNTPRYVQAGDTFTVILTMEKTLQTPPLTLSLELDTTASVPFTAVAGPKLTFAEAAGTEEALCRFAYQVQAGATPGLSGKIAYTATGATLNIGDKQVALVPDVDNVVQVTAEPVEEHLMEDYFKRPLDDVLESSDDSCLYLAKLNLKKNGPSFSLEQVERVPFGEYVYNSSLLKKMGLQETSALKQTSDFKVTTTAETLPSNVQPTFSGQYDSTKQEFRFDLGIPQAKTPAEQQQINSGTLEISLVHHRGLNPFSKSARHFYSDEIVHGLGQGDVYVSVGLVDDHAMSDLVSGGDSVYYGDLDVFEESGFEAGLPECAIGTICYPKKGTFRIGIKLKESTDRDSLTVRWWAVRNVAVSPQQGTGTTQQTATGTPEQ